MPILGKHALAAVYEMAKAYVTKRCPEETAYFPVIWEQLALQPHAKAEGRSVREALGERVEGLRFAEKKPVRLLSPFVIATALATADEKEYRIGGNRKGKELLAYLQRQVEATGTLGEDEEGRLVITIRRYIVK